MRAARIIACLAILLSFGCASTRYSIDVNGYTGSGADALRSGSRVAVIQNRFEANPLLAAEIKTKLERLLVARGYRITSPDSADLVLLNVFGIGTPREIATGAVAMPIGNMIAYVPTSSVLYFRWLMVAVAPANHYGVADQTFDDVDWSWVAEVTSSGSSGDLRSVIDYMLIAAFQYFGNSTGRRVRVNVSGNDDRLRELYGR
jgi:hypothetical protein